LATEFNQARLRIDRFELPLFSKNSISFQITQSLVLIVDLICLLKGTTATCFVLFLLMFPLLFLCVLVFGLSVSKPLYQDAKSDSEWLHCRHTWLNDLSEFVNMH
jgi:hypothetical protein